MRMTGDDQKAAGSLVKPVDRVVGEGGLVHAEHGDDLLTQRTGGDVAGGQRGQRRALAGDDDILVDVTDEGGGQVFLRRTFGDNARFTGGQAHLDHVARVQNAAGARRLAVYGYGIKHLEPPERMLAEAEYARHNAAHSAAVLLGRNGMGERAHGQSSLTSGMRIL